MEIIKNKINNNTIKYQFAKEDNSKLTYAEFISFLESEDKLFQKKFRETLNDATSELSAYFWECIPVSKSTIDKPFEFTVTKSEELNNITQNFKPFSEYLTEPEKQAISFPNQKKDAILIIPNRPKDNVVFDFKNLSSFIKHAPIELQQALWKEVANRLSKELEKDETPKWLSTHGLGVHYLHVRIDNQPKYYSWEEYREFKENNEKTNSVVGGKDDKLSNQPAPITNQSNDELNQPDTSSTKNPLPSNNSSGSQTSKPNYNHENSKPDHKNNSSSIQQNPSNQTKLILDNSQPTPGRILIIISLAVGIIAIFALIIYWMKRKTK